MIEWERSNRMEHAGAALVRVIEKLVEECSRRRYEDPEAQRRGRIELGLEDPPEAEDAAAKGPGFTAR